MKPIDRPFKDTEEMAEHLMVAEGNEIRGRVFTLPKQSETVPTLYAHQAEALSRLEANDHSAILHLPTGSGKTRVAMEFIARILKRSPKTRVLWVSYPTTLIRQAMARLVEYTDELPTGLRFGWIESGKRGRRNRDLFEQCDVVFALRDTLTDLFGDACLKRAGSPVRRALTSRDGAHDLLVVYDECHQLGARGLQRTWRRMERTLYREGLVRKDLRVLGLSATPLPRNRRRHTLMRKVIFPMPSGHVEESGFEWGMHVAHRVANRSLEALEVLCPVNAYQQDSGFFDVPHDILDRAVRRAPIEEPPADGTGSDELLRFSSQFNARVMAHPAVLRFIAGRVATKIEELGKTLVFLPTIKAANGFYALLRAHPNTRDRVFMVHTRLHDVESADHEMHPYAELAAFKKMGERPCIMVNVDMLTTGFDDPKINTIVLGRLTFSMNLYWQMIGRGTRGPRSGGTTSCTVIDPIRLTRMYPIAEGYRPTLSQGNDHLVGGDDLGDGRMDPSLPVVHRSPAEISSNTVDESWFDGVQLTIEALAPVAPRTKPGRAPRQPDDTTQLRRSHGQLPEETTTRGRMIHLLAGLPDEAILRLLSHSKLKSIDELPAEMLYEHLLDEWLRDGLSGISHFFEQLKSVETYAAVRRHGLRCSNRKKAAQAAELICGYLVADGRPALLEFINPVWNGPSLKVLIKKKPRVYDVIDKSLDRRGVQSLLDRLNLPRSGKNKRVLVGRIFECLLWAHLK